MSDQPRSPTSAEQSVSVGDHREGDERCEGWELGGDAPRVRGEQEPVVVVPENVEDPVGAVADRAAHRRHERVVIERVERVGFSGGDVRPALTETNLQRVRPYLRVQPVE